MSLIPVFEIGLWNAWIIIVLGFLSGPIPISLINKEAIKKFTATPSVPYSKTEKILDRIYPLLALATIIYSIFLPLKLGTIWFCVGLQSPLLLPHLMDWLPKGPTAFQETLSVSEGS